MKKLFILALFIPLLSAAQKFEFSEMAGYSAPTVSNPSTGYTALTPGFSNQLCVNYYFVKHFSVGAFYELNAWSPAISSLGLTLDAHFRHLYAGVNVSQFDMAAPTRTRIDNNYFGVAASTTYKYQPSIAYGLHIGYYQPLTRHIALKAQLGYNMSTLKVQESSPEFNNIGVITFPNGSYNIPVTYYYILIGVSYRL